MKNSAKITNTHASNPKNPKIEIVKKNELPPEERCAGGRVSSNCHSSMGDCME
jgi:hypothetical protein